jgi:tetratricopeptide (TPR) repeat protein
MKRTPLPYAALALAVVLTTLAARAGADTVDSLDALAKQLDRVEDLFRSDSPELASAMLDTATGRLEAVAKVKPTDARAQALLARGYSYRGDGAKADAAFARAAQLAPDNAEYQFLHGSSLARARKTAEALAAYRRAAELDPKHARAALMVGVMLMESNADPNADEALTWFVKAAEIDPKFARAHANIGEVHQDRGAARAALAAYEKAVEAAPQDWRYRAKLVQLYHALGRTEERDHERAVLLEMWHDDKVDQPMFCREQFQAAGRKVQAYEHFDPRGDRALRYTFVVLKPDGRQPGYRLTLGSDKPVGAAARAKGEAGNDERLFRLDAHHPDGERRTFGTFKKDPSYDATRMRVVEVLEGKLKPVSDSKPGADGNLDIQVETGE